QDLGRTRRGTAGGRRRRPAGRAEHRHPGFPPAGPGPGVRGRRTVLGGGRPVREPAQAPCRGEGLRPADPGPWRRARPRRRRPGLPARLRRREGHAGAVNTVTANPRRVAVLGATGSIGTSALDVIGRHPDRLRATVLAAGCNVEALLSLCRRHRPLHAVVADEDCCEALRDGLRDAALDTRAHAGAGAIEEPAASGECDTVVAGIDAAGGLPSTLAAARSGKRLLLANKES